MRLRFTLWLFAMLLGQPQFGGSESLDKSSAWIAAARLLQNGQPSGSGIYLHSGLVLTAAHLVDVHSTTGVRLGGVDTPAKIVKQGLYEDEDLSLLLIDKDKLPAGLELPPVSLCEAPPWPGDPVIVVDANGATRSQVASPQIIPYMQRHKFATLILDVATTGNSGSGVFDPNRKCLLGIMSRKFVSTDSGVTKDIAKYFVPANEIREFIPAEFRSVR